MGSATREAIAAANAALAQQGTVDLATGEQLLSAALVVNGSHELRAALADDTAKDSDRVGIVRAIFGEYTKPAQAILEALCQSCPQQDRAAASRVLALLRTWDPFGDPRFHCDEVPFAPQRALALLQESAPKDLIVTCDAGENRLVSQEKQLVQVNVIF